MSETKIITQRLILRPFELEDASRLEILLDDERISQMTANIPYPYPQGAATAWILSHKLSQDVMNSFAFAITEKEGGQVLGAVTLVNSRSTHRQAEIGYWLGSPFWNCGIMTEAVSGVLGFGFRQLSLHQINGRVLVRNGASGAVMTKNGFVKSRLTTHMILHNKREELNLYYLPRWRWQKQKLSKMVNFFRVTQG